MRERSGRAPKLGLGLGLRVRARVGVGVRVGVRVVIRVRVCGREAAEHLAQAERDEAVFDGVG